MLYLIHEKVNFTMNIVYDNYIVVDIYNKFIGFFNNILIYWLKYDIDFNHSSLSYSFFLE